MIVISGASRGIGRAIADRLTNSGHRVFGLARSTDRLPGEGMRCDVSSHEDLQRVARRLKEDNVEIRAVINAAGIASMNLALMTPPEVTTSIVNTNLLGTIFACQLLVPLMIRRRAGCVINFSSIAVPIGLQGESIYAASKSGVEAFSRSLAREVAGFGIRVNCVSPGPLPTDLVAGVPRDKIDAVVARQIIPRQFDVSDVCDVAELLLDDRAASISGQVIHVGGA